MQVMDELRHFESYVEDQHEAGASMQKLYERVQSSGNVVPRLYLLVAVGAVYIKSREAPARDVLSDLVDMLKGVHHPLRGLFLRHYLSQRVREELPDTGSVYEQAGGGTVRDAIGFLVQNLRETNRLWIRLQHQDQGDARPVGAREKERMELRLLVGTSLVRLSQLEGVTLRVYTDQVLPRVVEEIVLACKDAMAQQYLMDCLVHVFPDEFHLHNLAKVLTALETLPPAVDVALTLTALLERLTKFQEARGPVIKARGEEEGPKGEQAQENRQVFEQFLATTSRILLHPSRYHVEAQDDASTDTSAHVHVASALSLFVTFASFTLTWLGTTPGTQNPRTTSAVQQLGTLCLAFLDKQGPTWRDESHNPLRQLLTTQLHALTSTLFHALSIADLMHVPALVDLIAYMPWQGARKDVALAFIRVLLARHERVYDATQTAFLLQILAPLVRDDPTALPSPPLVCNASDTTFETFANEQQSLAKIIHLLRNDQLDARFQSFVVARRAFLQGGVFRMRFTLVPLMYQSLALARELAMPREAKTHGHREERDRDEPRPAFDTTPHQVLQFTHEIVTALASKHDALSVSCVHLFLQCALVADRCAFDAIAYEFITQAFIVYEDQITRARDQWRALELMVASLRVTCNLSRANYETLATKTTQYAARLLKKKDQALMVLKCAHLFWVREWDFLIGHFIVVPHVVAIAIAMSAASLSTRWQTRARMSAALASYCRCTQGDVVESSFALFGYL